MSTLKTDAIEAATGTNTDLELSGKGTGVPDIAAGFKVGGSAGVPTASIQDDAVTLAKLASGTDGELITWDAADLKAKINELTEKEQKLIIQGYHQPLNG